MTPWIPVLKPAGWQGASKAVCHPLLALEDPRDDLPWVALGQDRPTQLLYPPRDQLVDDDLAALGKTAMANLEARTATWVQVKPGLVQASDDYFAAERLLLPSFLALAHEALESELIAVAAPRRGLLLAHAPTQLGPFVAWVSELFHAEADEPISPLVLAVRGARIHGIIEDQAAQRMGRDKALTRDEIPAHASLRVAGWAESDQALVLTCALEPGQGLSTKTLDELGQLARVNLWQGKPVRSLRVVFPDQTQAKRWGPKLQERNIVVQYLLPGGGFKLL